MTGSTTMHRHADRQPTTLFEDAIDVPLWLETDRTLPYAARVDRDRRISASLDERDPVARVRAWWRSIREGNLPTEWNEHAEGTGRVERSERSVGQRLAHGRVWVNLVLIVVGIVFGAAITGAAFHYDGTEPVNVVRVLGLLVAPQLFLMLLTLLFATGRMPGAGRLQIGAIAAAAFRGLAHLPSGTMHDLFYWRRSGTATARFAQWQVLTWSQVAAVAFNLAALATAIALIAFTDLAFGWSTTLDLNIHQARAIVETLAMPWRAWLPDAVPDAALIEASRFFRLDDGTNAVAGATLTGWWPFVLCTVVTYGLLPRVVLLIVALLRQHAATRALLLDDARVTALIDRMSTPSLVFDPGEKEDSAQSGPVAAQPAPRRATGSARAIVWAGSLAVTQAADFVKRRLGLSLDAVLEAGGGQRLGEDRSTIAAIGDAAGSVVVLVRAFEPPLLELLDFLRALRERIGPWTSIVVVPVPVSGEEVAPVHRATWVSMISRLKDGATYVETGS